MGIHLGCLKVYNLGYLTVKCLDLTKSVTMMERDLENVMAYMKLQS